MRQHRACDFPWGQDGPGMNTEVPMFDTAVTQESPEQLYCRYVAYEADATAAILDVLGDGSGRDYFLRIHRVMDFDEFRTWLCAAASRPRQYRELVRALRGGYAAQLRRERDAFRASASAGPDQDAW